METATFIFGFIFFLNLWRLSNELKCYQCGEQGDHCNKPDTMDCPPNQDKCYLYRSSGTKHTPKYEMRGCISSVEEAAKREIHCTSDDIKCETCEKDLCNKTSKIGPSLVLLSVLMTLLLFVKCSLFE